jgi:hypothetical protein
MLRQVQGELRDAVSALRESRALLKEYKSRCVDPSWNAGFNAPPRPPLDPRKSCWWSEVEKMKTAVAKDKAELELLVAVESELKEEGDQCWRAGCPGTVPEGKVGCGKHRIEPDDDETDDTNEEAGAEFDEHLAERTVNVGLAASSGRKS